MISLHRHDIVVVGGGTGGIAVTASLLTRDHTLDIAIIEPSEIHYYRPGWTLIGGGQFKAERTARPTQDLIPQGAHWIRERALGFEPANNQIVLANGSKVVYNQLIVATGLELLWNTIEGLEETLGKNGVTSNYRHDLAPYTWELIQSFDRGTALFTQPPMPIQHAGAPQEAMYLACSWWHKKNILEDLHVSFHNANNTLFPVPSYLPALIKYIRKYTIELNLQQKLTAVDGPLGKAWFDVAKGDGTSKQEERDFGMLHVCPPQAAPQHISNSPLANEAGWLDLDPYTLRHKTFDNIYGLGDVGSTPNAKTAAAIRAQAPVVANNILFDQAKLTEKMYYNGYGSCPLTVEHGKVVLAEFGYNAELQPTFPKWLINGQNPTRRAWLLKKHLLPPIYWNQLLKGKEWLVHKSSQ